MTGPRTAGAGWRLPVLATGAFAWYAATLLWLAGLPIADLVPWLATFLVATIAGERLELAHVALRGPRASRWFLAALAVLVAGATAATLWPYAGTHLFGAGLLAVVAWLAIFDVARRTRPRPGPAPLHRGRATPGWHWPVCCGQVPAAPSPVPATTPPCTRCSSASPCR